MTFTTVNFVVKFMCESPKTIVFRNAHRAGDNFSVARFFLKLVWQNGEDEKMIENKQKTARRSNCMRMDNIGSQ